MNAWKFGLILAGTLATGWLAGCGSEMAACGSNSDCGKNRICDEGVCIDQTQVICTSNVDCLTGFYCSNTTCEPIPREDDTDVPDTDVPDTEPEPDTDSGTEPTPVDTVNPTVIQITPAHAMKDVPLDTLVTVKFSEAMNQASINFMSLVLKDPAGQDVPSQVTYDTDTLTATLTPNAPLKAATGYRVVPTALLRDQQDNPLIISPSPDATFYTVLNEPTHHEELARQFAPVIFQSLETTTPGPRNIDIPTTVDFDDHVARNNKRNALTSTANPLAQVYYSVVESESHYFITYALYYPVRRDKNTETNYEHDFTGALFVVDRHTQDLLLVEGIKVDTSTSDTVIAFKPSQSGVTKTQDFHFKTVQEADHVDGRFPLFITSGSHEACHWATEGPTTPAICRHRSKEFSDGANAGIVLKPGQAHLYNQSVVNPDTQLREMEYGLVPLSSLWARRGEVGEELLWQQVSVYAPLDERPATYPDDSLIVLPGQLFSDDTQSFGKSPFQWHRQPTGNNYGQWLFDPGYILQIRYVFPETPSVDYCHNTFLGIDRLTTPACSQPEPGEHP